MGVEAGRFEYGVLLQHFGVHADRERLLSAGRRLERLGFSSAWVRDHVVYEPHGHEDQDPTHLDPFVVLSALAGTTERLKLGTATMIPHRHPIHAAGVLASLDFLASRRVIAGIGLGSYQHEFEAVGLGGFDRRHLVEEYVRILGQLWAGEKVTQTGGFYEFTNVRIRPAPMEPSRIPVWYGGSSLASVRRAVEYCDGWLAGRIPYAALEQRLRRMRELSERAGRELPTVAMMPYVVPGRTVEEAMSRVDVPNLVKELEWLYPDLPSIGQGPVDGAVIAGPPDVIIERVEHLHGLGVEHLVFDLRPSRDRFDDDLALISEQVLPALRAGRS